MNLFKSFKNLWRRPAPAKKPMTPLSPEPEPEEIVVPELTPREVQERLRGDAPPLLLDVREPYEWRQVRIPDALHIPMNSVPDRLDALPSDRPIVVFCAHGIRSFGVAHFLRQHGLEAYNLAGGITQWQIQGGEVEGRRS
jgi:rhodanese-related sulfurtransferase